MDNILRYIRKHALAVFLVLTVMVLEIGVFNLPFWQSLTATPRSIHSVTLGAGLDRQSDGTAIITDPSTAWREIHNDAGINYLYFNPSEQDNQVTSVVWKTATKGDHDGGYYSASSVVGYSPEYNRSRYVHIGGNSTYFRMHFEGEKGTKVLLPTITVNPRIPFHIDIIRLALECIIAVFIWSFRPRSRVYERMFMDHKILDLTYLVGIALVQVGFVIGLWYVAGGLDAGSGIGKMHNGTYFMFDQYGVMADSLLHGKVNLDFPVNSDLAAMSNPYDYLTRISVAQHSHDSTPILFDVAFKDGKYYSYFGVLPVILLFMPYQVITGHMMSSSVGILILACTLVIASIWMIVQFGLYLRSRLGTISSGVILLPASLIIFLEAIVSTVQARLFYAIPQYMGLILVSLAMGCWLIAKRRNLHLGWLSLGTLLLTLCLACRPQYILAGLIAIPFFWDEIRCLWLDGLHSKKALVHELTVWSAVLVPFVAVCIAVCWYNAVRFGNFFDFGANYNLTGYDMTHHTLPWTQLVPMFFLYFLQPPNIGLSFPFISQTQQQMPLWLPMQPSMGGYFTFIAPFALIIGCYAYYRMNLRRLHLQPTFMTICIAAMVIFAFDVHIVGYDVRYILDFSWAITMLFLLVCMSVCYEHSIHFPDSIHADEVVMRKTSHVTSLIINLVIVGACIAIIFAFFNGIGHAGIHVYYRWWRVNSWFMFI